MCLPLMGWNVPRRKSRGERAEGKPVKGYEHRVPVSWIEKAYVREVKDEGEVEKVSV